MRRLGSLLIIIILVGSIIFTWIGRQEIYDRWMLHNYTAPAEVVELANQTTMTPKGRQIFYVNHPQIAQSNQFNSSCSPENSIVIGCYIPGKGIFIFDITDPRLAGVKEVTAGHEMLHAGYERLSQSERKRIDLLTQEALSSLDNPRIKDNIEKYRQQDASTVPNELHSILATEVEKLSPELEEYYKQYFNNRQVIVAYSNRYESEFTKRQQQIANYDNQLATMKSEIDADKNELRVQLASLTSEKQTLDSLLSQNRIAEYNSSAPGFNANVNSYNALVKKVDDGINAFNSLVEKRNSIAVEIQDLVKSMDSDSRPQSF